MPTKKIIVWPKTRPMMILVVCRAHLFCSLNFHTMIFARSFIATILFACVAIERVYSIHVGAKNNIGERAERAERAWRSEKWEREEDETVSPQAYDNFYRIIKAHILFRPFQLTFTYAQAWIVVFVVVVNVFSFLLFSFSHLLGFALMMLVLMLLLLCHCCRCRIY